jgi:hypothetical protein
MNVYDAEYHKTLSDYELEHITRTHVPSAKEHKLALSEICRRKQEKEGKSDKTQRNIEIMTGIILILTVVILLVTILK